MAVWREAVSREQQLTMTEREYLSLIKACTRAKDESWSVSRTGNDVAGGYNTIAEASYLVAGRVSRLMCQEDSEKSLG